MLCCNMDVPEEIPKPQRFRVYVSGAVRNPGPVDFDSNSGLTVLQAITLAGGPSERANLGKVQAISYGSAAAPKR